MREEKDPALLSIYEPIREELAQVEERLSSLRHNDFPFLSELLSYILETPGKGIRPAMTLLASKFYPEESQRPIIMAIAVELLHIATLIHDDTVDRALMRRGKATVNNIWGRDVAVLLGDYLFATSALFVTQTENVRVIRRFAETIAELSKGELIESLFAYNWKQTQEDYWSRIYSKTASLFSTATESGAVLSEAPESAIQALKEYGLNLGMAFQIVDDILDLEGSEEEIGKPVGNDLLQGTLTLPSLLLIERYPDDNPVIRLFQNRAQDGDLQKAISMIRDSSVIEDTYHIAKEFGQKASQALQILPDNRYRRSLLDLVSYVVERKS